MRRECVASVSGPTTPDSSDAVTSDDADQASVAALSRHVARKLACERLPLHEISRYPEVVRRGLFPMEGYVRSLVAQPPFLPLPAVLAVSSYPSAFIFAPTVGESSREV